jgi:hypothetical protein
LPSFFLALRAGPLVVFVVEGAGIFRAGPHDDAELAEVAEVAVLVEGAAERPVFVVAAITPPLGCAGMPLASAFPASAACPLAQEPDTVATAKAS